MKIMDSAKTKFTHWHSQARCLPLLCKILLLWLVTMPTIAQNNPYIDDKLVHFGFSLGVNMMAYGVTESGMEIDGERYHVRQSGLMPGFSVGFITDLRLCRFLNLRFVPGLSFASRTLSYKSESGNPVAGSLGTNEHVEILAIPISLPLQLKWSAARENNYRPYVVVGGGASYNVFPDRKKAVCQGGWDAFVEAGFGCDFYFSWFKFCPEIKYQIGFLNQLMPLEGRTEVVPADFFYTQAIGRLTNHTISIVFNFE